MKAIIKPIRTEADYEEALAEAESLMEALDRVPPRRIASRS